MADYSFLPCCHLLGEPEKYSSQENYEYSSMVLEDLVLSEVYLIILIYLIIHLRVNQI